MATARLQRILAQLCPSLDAGPEGNKIHGFSKVSAAKKSPEQAWEKQAQTMTKQEVLKIRKKCFSRSQSISYENTAPLMIVRGEGCYLIDENGNRYLDSRNNVNHVGHQNPKVADAVAKQVRILNSNTRYLHSNVALLAKRLLRTFPEKLSVVFFVNSGSEANDLAIRLARAHSKHGSKDVITVERAYHGHTQNVIQISPYKFLGKGGGGKSEHVHVVPCPDTYRGEFRGEDAAERYAETVREACGRSKDGKVAAFFIESGMSVAGVVLPPQGYLKRCYEYVRAAGGVCVADEVQTGFGRFGDFFWGFEQQGVVPDIVTMGKPFGNGMPLAAVVTTKAISESFSNGMEYFNTFGGNPVCCAAGLAVLEAIEMRGRNDAHVQFSLYSSIRSVKKTPSPPSEKLQERARLTGEYLRGRLREMQRTHALIGDIRGSGLFCGVEFVRERKSREPATAEVSEICSRLKNSYNILTTVDGKHDNVIVIKPPMVFGRKEADVLLSALTEVLSNLGSIDPDSYSHTPT
eukprot:jgi/Bigna1/71214/fgenesh1_pg.14_\